MTKSELICNEIGKKFFNGDFVYQGLHYFNSSNNKVELCDALFEWDDFYLALQIKEKTTSKKVAEKWLNDVVYGDAVKQINQTIKAISTENICMQDLFQQKIELDKSKIIYPIIVFYNTDVRDYKRIFVSSESKEEPTLINIFNIFDYQTMMQVLVHPFDIISYLDKRSEFMSETDGSLPTVLLSEGSNFSMMSTDVNEEELARHYRELIFDNEERKNIDCSRLLGMIQDFREKRSIKDPVYRKIVKILQMLRPNECTNFMVGVRISWDMAEQDKVGFGRSMILDKGEERIIICFYSNGISKSNFRTKNRDEVLCRAKQQQYMADKVLLVEDVKQENQNKYLVNWVYFESKYVEDLEFIKALQQPGGIIPEDWDFSKIARQKN